MQPSCGAIANPEKPAALVLVPIYIIPIGCNIGTAGKYYRTQWPLPVARALILATLTENVCFASSASELVNY